MSRSALSQEQLDDFRTSLCAVATRLFAEHGYEGVTMRALADGLGCSPMTPYRYFETKSEIFNTVRSVGAHRFADAIAKAVRSHDDHAARLRAMCLAYVDFALREPHAYRIIFELDRKRGSDELSDGELRGWHVMRDAVAEAIQAGVLTGDPTMVAHLLWSGVHGIVALHLSGMLALGIEIEALVEAFADRELGRGAALYELPPPPSAKELSSDR